jgi:ATP-binding cassette subfamily B protein
MLKMMINNLVNRSNYQNISKALLFHTLSYIALLITLNIAFCLLDNFSLKIFPKLKSLISLEKMKYLELHSYEFFQNHLGGSDSNRVYDLTNGSEKIIQLILNSFLPSSLVLINEYGIALFIVHYYFAFIMYIWAIVFFSINVILSKNFKNLSNTFSVSRNNLMRKIVDSITNINNVRLFTSTQYEIDIIDKWLNDVILKEEKVGWSFLFIHFFQNSLTIVLTIVLIILFVFAKQKNLITAGDFLLVITLSFSISDAVKILSRSYTDISKEIGIYKQALNAINFSHSISDKPDDGLLKVTNDKIIFKNVSFFYSENNNIFKNQTFNIVGKKKVGIVGYSSSGKSMLVNLITRLFDVKGGQILIDDQNITDITQDSLRNNIGFIPQDHILFHRSIIENIRYGNLNATDKEVFEAARQAYSQVGRFLPNNGLLENNSNNELQLISG